tara:strand:- start:443 stop:607 length:165 start_codon:yes stop_codon:yes gene_type:complete
MNELEKAAIRVFTLIMIGLGVILWLQLQGCAPPSKIIPDTNEYIEPDSTLAYGR